MKGFKEYISEGVVKVPPKLYKKVEDALWQTALGVAWDSVQKKKDEEPQFYNWFDKQAKKYKVRGPLKKQKEYAFSFNYELKNLPKNYPREKVRRLNLVITNDDARDTGTGGHFKPDANEVMAAMGQMSFDRYPNTDYGYDIKNFKGSLNSVLTTLRHELMHSVQYNLLAKVDPRQTDDKSYMKAMDLSPEKKKEYAAKYGKTFAKDLYYSSQLEFDPQLVSAIGELKNLIAIKEVRSNKLSDEEKMRLFKVATGITEKQGGLFSAERTFKLFDTLKRIDKDKWKLAVKKFYLLAIKEKLIKSNKGFKL